MKLNITKGEVTAVQNEVVSANGMVIAKSRHMYGMSSEKAAANAALIAESFNVANETGLTPRELWDRLSAANKLLREHGLIQAI